MNIKEEKEFFLHVHESSLDLTGRSGGKKLYFNLSCVTHYSTIHTHTRVKEKDVNYENIALLIQ